MITWVRSFPILIASLLSLSPIAVDKQRPTTHTWLLSCVLTQRHNKNPGTISYGGGDPGAFIALTVQEPTSIRLAQLRLQHAQVYALDVKSDEATRSPHWPDLLAQSMSAN
eukprot:COSAG02_NODE_396_length_23126_cov_282.150258_21_plen_111_part_00